jgi:ParB family chromosome partitioning protein
MKENKNEQVVMIHHTKMIDFEDNPFKVIFDEKMDELIESIKENGVLTPITVRSKDDNYEILSGQRRVAACRFIGTESIPAVIKQIDDNDAAILLVDSNLYREELLFSEKAFAYKLKLDAMKCQGKRNDLTSDQVGRKSESREVLAEQVGESKSQISRYIRLTELVYKLLDMVDAKIMPFNVGVELSYLGIKEQMYIADILEYDEIMLSLSQATEIRKQSVNGKISEEDIRKIIYNQKPSKFNITIKNKWVKEYFPENYSKEQIEDIVLNLIKKWHSKRKNQNIV